MQLKKDMYIQKKNIYDKKSVYKKNVYTIRKQKNRQKDRKIENNFTIYQQCLNIRNSAKTNCYTLIERVTWGVKDK